MTPASTRTVLVVAVGTATGTGAAAAALACAGSGPDSAALSIDLGLAGRPRSTLVATTAARELEERVAAHLPDAAVASRGRFCHLSLPGDSTGVVRISEALPLVRESLAVVHLPPSLLQPALDEVRIRPSAALLRADLAVDRALTALVAGDLIARGVRTTVLKHPLGLLAARAALLGALPPGSQGLPVRLRGRLLDSADASGERTWTV